LLSGENSVNTAYSCPCIVIYLSVEESPSDALPPERLLERSAKMNPGEIVLARMWSTERWRRECPPSA
jgi:hypothetical protein